MYVSKTSLVSWHIQCAFRDQVHHVFLLYYYKSSTRFNTKCSSPVLKAGFPKNGHDAHRKASPLGQFPQALDFCNNSSLVSSSAGITFPSARPHEQLSHGRRPAQSSVLFVFGASIFGGFKKASLATSPPVNKSSSSIRSSVSSRFTSTAVLSLGNGRLCVLVRSFRCTCKMMSSFDKCSSDVALRPANNKDVWISFKDDGRVFSLESDDTIIFTCAFGRKNGIQFANSKGLL
mmetsp:Transcript_7194/g.10509  ORF Transcript_7194/g.10509 Transcript_7194/m.10509 type:complete len:233 (-) Transcript_7194:319-1017(-)